MKVIVSIIHDRHTDDVLNVLKYSEENVEKVRKDFEGIYPDGTWRMCGDLPCNNGDQFGENENYYCSYSVVTVK